MTQQLSMMDLLCPPPPAPPPVAWVDNRYPLTIRAYGSATVITAFHDDTLPFEIEVRGIRATVVRGCTYVIDGAGSPFWSETGFRSFGGAPWETPDEAAVDVERYIAAPAKNGNGCGGKLVRWWPGYVNQWRQNVSFWRSCDRTTVWAQWGPEKHAECWARYDADQAAAIARMIAEGIDPNDVGPPAWHKGPWPRFECKEAQA